MTELRFHPLSEIFPLIEGDNFRTLVDDIRQNGLHEPITLDKAEEEGGAILDGRNRYQACLAADVEPAFDILQADTEPLAFILSKNVHRRHLNDSQRAMVAAKLATRSRGRPKKTPQFAVFSIEEAAKLLNVHPATVERAKAVLESASPELRSAVEYGDASVSAAAEVAKLPADQQRDIVKKGAARIASVAKTLRKQELRDLREIELASHQAQMPTQSFGVIYADPPWRHEPYSRETGMDRAADNHYPTLDTDAIAKLVPPAAEDSVCFLCTTIPFLRDGIRVLTAWGFDYKSSAVWVKDVAGTGYWFRQQHEIILVGTRGSIPAPAPGTQWSSVIDARRGKHSEKPAALYELIEAYFPHLSKIELFARSGRSGWTSWGNEAPVSQIPTSNDEAKWDTDDPVSEGIDSDESESYETEENELSDFPGQLENDAADEQFGERRTARTAAKPVEGNPPHRTGTMGLSPKSRISVGSNCPTSPNSIRDEPDSQAADQGDDESASYAESGPDGVSGPHRLARDHSEAPSGRSSGGEATGAGDASGASGNGNSGRGDRGSPQDAEGRSQLALPREAQGAEDGGGSRRVWRHSFRATA